MNAQPGSIRFVAHTWTTEQRRALNLVFGALTSQDQVEHA